MNPVRRFKRWRAAKREDRAAVARSAEQARRAGDEPPRSMSDTVEDVAGTFPPQS
jgi:hypothetical protein